MTTSQTPDPSPLRIFLRAMTADQKKAFAAECGTTLLYLYQIAASPAPNPTLRLAKAIVERSHRLSPMLATPALTYDDLLVPGAPEEASPARKASRAKK